MANISPDIKRSLIVLVSDNNLVVTGRRFLQQIYIYISQFSLSHYSLVQNNNISDYVVNLFCELAIIEPNFIYTT